MKNIFPEIDSYTYEIIKILNFTIFVQWTGKIPVGKNTKVSQFFVRFTHHVEADALNLQSSFKSSLMLKIKA